MSLNTSSFPCLYKQAQNLYRVWGCFLERMKHSVSRHEDMGFIYQILLSVHILGFYILLSEAWITLHVLFIYLFICDHKVSGLHKKVIKQKK